jgi:hypothetical protein
LNEAGSATGKARRFRGAAEVGEPRARHWPPAAERRWPRRGRAVPGAKLPAAQMRDPEAVLAALRLGEDQGWTLARTAELV